MKGKPLKEKIDAGIRIGTAAWTLPKIAHPLFPEEGSHLERYASVLNGVEINSSFYRDHQAKTYARWANSVPADFRFSAKLSKLLTHVQRLRTDSETREKLLKNFGEFAELGEKLEVVLVQLPPSLAFHADTAERFFEAMLEARNAVQKRAPSFQPAFAFEPRHRSWASDEANSVLAAYSISRVIADPEAVPMPKADPERFTYIRLHGSPEIYRSDYSIPFLDETAELLRSRSESGGKHWCIFDNTTFGYATVNAVYVKSRLGTRNARAHPASPKELGM